MVIKFIYYHAVRIEKSLLFLKMFHFLNQKIIQLKYEPFMFLTGFVQFTIIVKVL